MTVNIAVLPTSTPEMDAAAEAAGAVRTDLAQADGLVWTGSPTSFPDELPDRVRWVQLPSAGVERWFATGRIDDRRTWTSAVGAYSDDVAEHAVALLLGSLRLFPRFARTSTWEKKETWSVMRSLRGRTVAIVGAGSIGRAIIPLLTAHRASVIAVNRSGSPVEGAAETHTSEALDEVLRRADDAIVAGASTQRTRHLIGADQIAALGPDGVLVNIARGDLVDTDALVTALRDGGLFAAGLDVFEEEPLPDGHPLWSLDNALLTPHVANPLNSLHANLARHVEHNIRAFAAGEPLNAVIDLEKQY